MPQKYKTPKYPSSKQIELMALDLDVPASSHEANTEREWRERHRRENEELNKKVAERREERERQDALRERQDLGFQKTAVRTPKQQIDVYGGDADDLNSIKLALGVLDKQGTPTKETKRIKIDRLPDTYGEAFPGRGLVKIDPDAIRTKSIDYIRNLTGVLSHEDTHLRDMKGEFKSKDPNEKTILEHREMGSPAHRLAGPQKSVSTVRPLIRQDLDPQRSIEGDEAVIRRPFFAAEPFENLFPKTPLPKHSENELREKTRKEIDDWNRKNRK